MKSIAENLLEITAEIEGIGRLHRKFSSKPEAYPAYTALVGDAYSSLKIVTDTGEPVLFEHSPLMRETIENAINRRNINIQFVFHTDEDYSRAVEEFSKVNPNLWAFSSNPFQRLYLNLYWTPKRPNQHYSVIDKEWVYYEHPHERGQDTRVEIYHNNPFAEKLSSTFDGLIERCRKVE